MILRLVLLIFLVQVSNTSFAQTKGYKITVTIDAFEEELEESLADLVDAFFER